MENFKRLGKYTLVRGVLIVLSVVIGVFLTVVITTMGGHMDEIRRSQIKEEVAAMVAADEELQRLPAAEKHKIIRQMEALRWEHFDLHTPWITRTLQQTARAITLNLGMAKDMTSDAGSRQVRLIILERLPPTLLLMVTSNLILFFSALFTALVLSRRYGSMLDRVVVALSPTSAAPAWFYGIFLILIFASLLGVLPYGRMVDLVRPETTLGLVLSHLRHLVLPVLAVFIGGFFSGAFFWRTFFLVYSSEDYVEMAKAKGLSPQAVERRYILRPALPPIITSFGLMVITMWMGAIILETMFSWPGLGRMLFDAIGRGEVAVIAGTTVIYAYLLGITVFLLDLAYAALDPRVKLGAGGKRPA